MIYESVLVLRADLTEEGIASIKEIIAKVVKDFDGEVLLSDDWGIKAFAQPTAKGTDNGNFTFFMFKANTSCNREIERLLKINEGVLKYMIVRLGEDSQQEKLVKAYRKPGTPAEENKDGRDIDKDRRLFAKRKNCWFSATKTSPDWKDPSTYAWLVNEFGKISPARVTGLIPKFQRKATYAIKRGRCVGLISHISNRIVHW